MCHRFFIFLLVFFASSAFAKETLLTSPLAEAFGRQPAMKQVRLSPDGNKILYIVTHPDGLNYVEVYNFITSSAKPVLAGKKDKTEILECNWANNNRLLCEMFLVGSFLGDYIGATRLVGVSDDGTDFRVLLKRKNRELNFSQFQSEIIDFLPNDPEHVWLQLSEGDGVSVQKLNVYSGTVRDVKKKRKNVWDWLSNGDARLRLYTKIDAKEFSWHFSTENNNGWKLLKSHLLSEGYPTFQPLGFGVDPNKLFYFDDYHGRQGLFVKDLDAPTPADKMVYTRSDADMANVYRLGKNHRIVGVVYQLDHTYHYFFDELLSQVQGLLAGAFPDKTIRIVDEDWAQNRYLVHVSSDTDAGSYYLFNKEKRQVRLLKRLYPDIDKLTLAHMQPVTYPAKDGELVPGYLTLPTRGKAPYPTIILPHGGPSSRDVIEFDFLVQYLSAKGYAVLQSNYRGSSGYGSEWEGEGAFKQWRLAVSDVVDGADYLIKKGIANRDGLCVVGWSYGGYAAFMSAIENPEMFKCVGSIAGVTDLKNLGEFKRKFVGGRAAKEFIGTEDEVTIQGSPLLRAKELRQPVFMVHPRKDLQVPFRQGKAMAKALKKAGKDAEFIGYREAEHSIRPERYRIDMLTRLGDFLDRHLGNMSAAAVAE